jgi:hypothetical protein
MEVTIMKQINISINGMELDYKTANSIARSVANILDVEPTVVAWHDARANKMSPAIEGADIHSVNGDFDFIFADSNNFEELGHSPYISLQDEQGNQFLCRMEDLRDPKDPHQEACFSIEEDKTPSSMHAG